MAAPVKTQGTSLFSLANIAVSAVGLGAPLDVSTKIAGFVGIHLGRTSSSAFTTPPIIRVEASLKATTDGFWFPLAQFQPVLGASLTAQAVNGTCAAGQNVVPLASTTNLALQDLVYIKNTTIGSGEFARVKAISTNVSITLEDNLNNAQTGSTVYRAAEFYGMQLDLTSVGRIRVVVDNGANSVAGIDVEALATTFDSFA